MQQQRGSSGFGQRPPQYSNSDRQPSFIASDQYLRGGYFDQQGHIRPEIINVDALRAAMELSNANPKLSNSQLYLFLVKLRSIEVRLDAGTEFEEMRAEVASLSPAAAGAFNRKVAPRVFWTLMDKNVELALKSERAFREGFLQHFKSIVQYYPRQTGR